MLPTRTRQGLARWDYPFNWLDREMGRTMRMLMNGDPDQPESLTASYPVDIREDEDHYYIDAELPGFTRDQVNVTLEKGTVSITAEREPQSDDDQAKTQQHLNERRYTRIARSFTLPNTIDDSKVEAKLDNGVLHLQIAKQEQVKPRRIEIA